MSYELPSPDNLPKEKKEREKERERERERKRQGGREIE